MTRAARPRRPRCGRRPSRPLARNQLRRAGGRGRRRTRSPLRGPGAATATALAALLAAPSRSAAQTDPAAPAFDSTAFLDPAARRLHAAAAANWASLDESVVRYTALVEQRLAAAIRTPLKDRVLYRSEAAVRAFWDRDHDPVVQVLGSRSRYPGRDIAMREGDLDWLEDLPFDRPFEPGGDRLAFGVADGGDEMFRADADDPDADPENPFWFAHPLAPRAAEYYQFRSGDTLTLSLPDGRALSTVRLDVLPREADVHRIAGVLWIEPESGALVRAVYRMSRNFDAMRDVPELQREDEEGSFRFVPGVFKPWTFELDMIAVNYALWDFRVWLPRSMRVEGEAAAGILKVPVSMDVAYRMESVTTDEDEAAEAEAGRTEAEAGAAREARGGEGGAGEPMEHVHFATRAEALRFIGELLAEDGAAYEPLDDSEEAARARMAVLLAPADRARVDDSPHLPPPIWDEAPGFASEAELEAQVRSLAQLPAAPVEGTAWSAGLGWLGGSGLRYNRVEGPAAGGAVAADLGRRFSLKANGVFGLANLRPDVQVEFERSTALRRLSLELFYELRATDREGTYLGLGNSMKAFFLGTDEGDYYRAAGAALAWRPPALSRESFSLRVFGERHWSVGKETNFALFKAFSDGWAFRPNPAVEEVREAGGDLRLAPWWGRDPTEAQVGLEARLRAAAWDAAGRDGAPGDRYADASMVVRAAFPLSGGEWNAWRLGVEAGGGTTWGRAPRQRRFFVGGPPTLRGHPRAVASGRSFLRGRLEVARTYHAVAAAVFADAAWAGDRSGFDAGDLLYSLGIGASLMDGLVRLDFARGLNGPDPGFRVHLTLDSIL